MARVAGVNIADRKHTVIALQQIYGIGPTRAKQICAQTGVPESAVVKDLTEEQLESLRSAVGEYTIEGDLRREIGMDLKRLQSIKCFESGTACCYRRVEIRMMNRVVSSIGRE